MLAELNQMQQAMNNIDVRDQDDPNTTPSVQSHDEKSANQEALPADAYRKDIVELVNRDRVSIILGETG